MAGNARDELARIIGDALERADRIGDPAFEYHTADAILASPDVVLRALGREPLQEAHCDCCDYYGMDD